MPAYSTNMDTNYLRSKFVPQSQYKWRNQTISAPDALDPTYLLALSRLSAILAKPKIDGANITFLAYKLYGNTSAFWIILALNGYFHPLAIPSGTVVKYPASSQILNSDTFQSSAVGLNTNTTQLKEVSL